MLISDGGKLLAITVATVVSGIISAIGLIDKISDQLEEFLSKKKKPFVPREHRMKIERRGSDIVAIERGREEPQIITAADLQNLPESQLRHIMVYETSMQKQYNLWAAVYPQRNASPDPLVNAKVDQQLKSIVSGMKADLNGILGFLESNKLRLDDHYMEIRDLVNQV